MRHPERPHRRRGYLHLLHLPPERPADRARRRRPDAEAEDQVAGRAHLQRARPRGHVERRRHRGERPRLRRQPYRRIRALHRRGRGRWLHSALSKPLPRCARANPADSGHQVLRPAPSWMAVWQPHWHHERAEGAQAWRSIRLPVSGRDRPPRRPTDHRVLHRHHRQARPRRAGREPPHSERGCSPMQRRTATRGWRADADGAQNQHYCPRPARERGIAKPK